MLAAHVVELDRAALTQLIGPSLQNVLFFHTQLRQAAASGSGKVAKCALGEQASKMPQL
jgi:hypothetical protein